MEPQRASWPQEGLVLPRTPPPFFFSSFSWWRINKSKAPSPGVISEQRVLIDPQDPFNPEVLWTHCLGLSPQSWLSPLPNHSAYHLINLPEDGLGVAPLLSTGSWELGREPLSTQLGWCQTFFSTFWPPVFSCDSLSFSHTLQATQAPLPCLCSCSSLSS